MFCMNCGKELPDASKFCFSCGEALVLSNSNESFMVNTAVSQTTLVPAKCTGCGAALEVDNREKAAICPFCNNAYIVEQAINNYNIKMNGNLNVGTATINVNGVNVDNLLLRAKDFLAKGNFESALNYYNQVLDIDFSRQEAHDGINMTKHAIDNYTYFSSDANQGFSTGTLQLKKNRLIYLSKNGKEKVYYLNQITKLTKQATIIQFEYPKTFAAVTIGFKFGISKQWADIINSAMNGIYPEVKVYL